MEIDDGSLIQLVRHFSLIYDKKHACYKDQTARENAWTTIASILNTDGNETHLSVEVVTFLLIIIKCFNKCV
jgi:hypothetical protein